MKKLLTFATCAIAASLAVSAQAQTITSIQFIAPYNGTALASTDVAGVDPAANWLSDPMGYSTGSTLPNYWTGSTSPATRTISTGLVDSTGALSSIGYSITGYGNQSYGSSMSGYNGDLLNGGDVGGGAGSPYSQPVTLTLTGLTVGDNYNFLVYVAGGYSNLTYGMFALSGGPTYYLQTPNGDGVLGGPTVFQNNSTITDVWGPQPAGTPLTETLISNYVSFSGITATSASETITATELGTFSFGQWAPQPNANNYYNSFGISGVQVIDNGPAVPEPSTWAMMLGGLGMLLTGQRIRRSRKS